MKLHLILSQCFALSLLIGYAAFNTAQGAQPSVTVQSYARHAGANTIYTYRVTNHGPGNLFRFSIGCVCRDYKDTPPVPEDEPQLVIYPVDYNFDDGENGSTSENSYSAPIGWYGLVAHYEGIGYFSFDFDTDWDSGISLLPGITATFSITTPTKGEDFSYHPLGNAYFYDKNKRGYLSGHYSYREDRGSRVVSYPMQLIDTTPPNLSITLTPNTLFPPNKKLVPITATVTAQDDYDPEPEIKLESITANEKLEAEDIRDAALGTDDRQFRLRAERRGERDKRDGRERDDRREKDHRSDIDASAVPTGRIYTVTYSATDASGNKTTASATVTVPHDQRKNDRDEKDKGDDKGKWNR